MKIVKRNEIHGESNGITQKENSRGGIERNYYDGNGNQMKQVSNNNHGNPKKHPYGKNGEHTHEYIYDENGNLKDMGENRFIQMIADPKDFQLIVSGDPARDHVIIGAQNGFMGWPTSKKIELPEKWDELLNNGRK